MLPVNAPVTVAAAANVQSPVLFVMVAETVEVVATLRVMIKSTSAASKIILERNAVLATVEFAKPTKPLSVPAVS